MNHLHHQNHLFISSQWHLAAEEVASEAVALVVAEVVDVDEDDHLVNMDLKGGSIIPGRPM